MQKKQFTYEISDDDKEIYVYGPWELAVTVDHDDVNHPKVKHELHKLLALLEDHWNKPTITT